MTSDVPGAVVTAAVGYALPDDPGAPGIIMEYHDHGDRQTAERMIRTMLEEAFRTRGAAIREMRIFSADHRVERVGCAVAAVVLLADDDLA
jgi:arginine decarboxylase